MPFEARAGKKSLYALPGTCQRMDRVCEQVDDVQWSLKPWMKTRRALAASSVCPEGVDDG